MFTTCTTKCILHRRRKRKTIVVNNLFITAFQSRVWTSQGQNLVLLVLVTLVQWFPQQYCNFHVQPCFSHETGQLEVIATTGTCHGVPPRAIYTRSVEKKSRRGKSDWRIINSSYSSRQQYSTAFFEQIQYWSSFQDYGIIVRELSNSKKITNGTIVT